MVLRSALPSSTKFLRKVMVPEKLKSKVHQHQIIKIDRLRYSHFNSTILGPLKVHLQKYSMVHDS